MKRVLLTIGVAGLLLSSAAQAGTKKAPPPPPPPAPVAPPPPPPDPNAWRAQPPPPAPERPWAPPEASVAKLSNGIQVFFVQNNALPLVTVRLHMNVGRSTNPVGKGGLSSVVADLLDEGTKSYDAIGLAAQQQQLGAQLSTFAGDEGSEVVLSAMSAELGGSLDLMAEVVRAPAFRGSDFARVQSATLADLEAARSDPRTILRQVLLRQLYGKDHPYGVPTRGTEASIRGLKLSDVKKFYKTWWTANNASFVVAGATDQATILKELEARFGSWKGNDIQHPAIQAPSPVMKTRIVFVEQAGSVQSMIATVTPGVTRNSPDWTAANVAGTWIAGMFSSPMNMVLREEKGWSYGAYGAFTESRDYGVFSVRTSVQADKTAPAVAEMLKVLATASSAPPPEEMLSLAKDNLRKSLPGNFDTNANTAASLASLVTYALPNDAWRTFDHDVEVITAARTASIANRYFRPERQLIVVVGPRTVKGTDASGAALDVDVVKELQGLGYEFVEEKVE